MRRKYKREWLEDIKQLIINLIKNYLSINFFITINGIIKEVGPLWGVPLTRKQVSNILK